MNESELRRQELLRQTRKLYNDHNELPAVHPRYGRICSSLYGDGRTAAEHSTSSGGSFYVRLVMVIGILCFVFYVCVDQSQAEIAQVSSSVIAEQIGQDMDADALIETLASP